jgi:hypothetical protein
MPPRRFAPSDLPQGSAAQVLLDGIEKDAQSAVEGFAVVLEVVAQPLGQGEHPLAHRQTGQDMLGEVGGGLRHPPGVARGADAAAFAGEGDEKVMAAFVTAGAGEPVGQDATLQVASQFPFGVRRHAPLPPVIVA